MNIHLSRREFLKAAGGATATLMLGSTAARAQAAAAYPSKPITWVVPQPVGGDADAVCRLLQPRMGQEFGQSLIIDNKGGAGGNIGVAYGAKAKADGYTITFVNQGILAFNPYIYRNIGFNPADLAPVTWMTSTDLVICVNPNHLKVDSMAAFLDLARKSPGKYTFGSAGVGSANHIAGQLLESMANVSLTHIPYRGGGPAIVGALGGQIDSVVAFPLGALPLIKSGKLKALAVTGAKRSTALPDVPTVAESVPGYDFSSWFGLVVPKGTPAGVINRINQVTTDALQVPATVKRLREGMTEPVGRGPKEFAEFIAREQARWSSLIKKYNIEAS